MPDNSLTTEDVHGNFFQYVTNKQLPIIVARNIHILVCMANEYIVRLIGQVIPTLYVPVKAAGYEE